MPNGPTSTRRAQRRGICCWDRLAWPRWSFTTGGNATRDVVANDIRALLLVVLVAALLGMAGANFASGGGAFVLAGSPSSSVPRSPRCSPTFLTTQAALPTRWSARDRYRCRTAYSLGWIVGCSRPQTRRTTAVAA